MSKRKLSEEKVKELVNPEVEEVRLMERDLTVLETTLSHNPEFKRFLELQKAVAQKSAEVKANVLKVMTANSVKTIENDWLRVTVVDNLKYSGDIDTVDQEFVKVKRELDGKKIKDHETLYGELPEGVEKENNPYIRMTPKKQHDGIGFVS